MDRNSLFCLFFHFFFFFQKHVENVVHDEVVEDAKKEGIHYDMTSRVVDVGKSILNFFLKWLFKSQVSRHTCKNEKEMKEYISLLC